MSIYFNETKKKPNIFANSPVCYWKLGSLFHAIVSTKFRFLSQPRLLPPPIMFSTRYLKYLRKETEKIGTNCMLLLHFLYSATLWRFWITTFWSPDVFRDIIRYISRFSNAQSTVNEGHLLRDYYDVSAKFDEHKMGIKLLNEGDGYKVSVLERWQKNVRRTTQ